MPFTEVNETPTCCQVMAATHLMTPAALFNHTTGQGKQVKQEEKKKGGQSFQGACISLDNLRRGEIPEPD